MPEVMNHVAFEEAEDFARRSRTPSPKPPSQKAAGSPESDG